MSDVSQFAQIVSQAMMVAVVLEVPRRRAGIVSRAFIIKISLLTLLIAVFLVVSSCFGIYFVYSSTVPCTSTFLHIFFFSPQHIRKMHWNHSAILASDTNYLSYFSLRCYINLFSFMFR